MLSILLYKRTHFTRPLSHTIGGDEAQRGSCEVQIGYKKWDFNDLLENEPVYQYSYEGLNYYISPKKPLKSSDLPSYAILEPDTRAMVCNETKKSCWEIAYATDFDYKYKSSTDHDAGIIMFADGIPHSNHSDNLYYTAYDISYDFTCDASATGSVTPTVVGPTRVGDHVQIFFTYKTSAGCPTTVSTYPENPMSFEPDCKFTSLLSNTTDLGIQVDFSTLNNGPVGIRSLIISSGDPFLFYYTPCGFSDCPYSANECVDGVTSSTNKRGVSSAWLCTLDDQGSEIVIQKCTSYGLEQQQPDIQVEGDEWDGITHTLRYQGERSVQVHYDCEQTYPLGYIEFPLIAHEISSTKVIINVDNSDVCLHPIPPPIPTDELCKNNISMNGPDNNPYTVDLDLKTLNTENGYKITDFTVQTMPPQTYTLIYQPCAGLICPTSSEGTPYTCDGDEYATVWLCEDAGGGLGHNPTCDAYGLFTNVSLYETELVNRTVMKGLKFIYNGDLHRKAAFSLVCDESMISGTIELDKTGSFYGNTLLFSGRSKDVCASGTGPTPTPFPIPQPKIPTPFVTPTPNPRPNNDVFIHNSTHFIYIDLERVDKDIYQHEDTLYINGQSGPLYTEFSPWKKLPCPVGWKCPSYANESNVWSCWGFNDEAQTLYCQNSGDINISISFNNLGRESILDNGLMLKFGGAYGLSTDFRLICKHGKNISSLSNLNSLVTFTFQNGGEFEYSTQTELACPSKFTNPDSYYPIVITPTPTPTPHSISYTYTSEMVNGKRLEVDLHKLQNQMTEVFIGNGDHFMAVNASFSLSTPHGCPSGYECNTSTPANIYICYISEKSDKTEKRCFVIGDANYELNIIQSDSSDPSKGFRLEYGGGQGSYETFIQFHCNESVKTPKWQIHEVGHMYGTKKVIFEVESSMACPTLSYHPNNVTGGAVFLTLILGGFSLYVVISVLVVFFTTGEILFPHKDFWVNFFTYVSTGAIFVFTCGKKVSINTSSQYETI